MGGMIVCDKICLGVVSTFSLSCDVNPPWLMKLSEKGFMAIEFLLEDLSLGR